MLRLLSENKDAFLRASALAHMTASAWVVDASGTRVLMLYHNIYHSWSWAGGHAVVDEDLLAVAIREVQEETGIDVQAPGCRLTDWGLENHYDIWPQWRHRYAPDVSRNRERVFGLCVPAVVSAVLNPREHVRFQWLPWLDAADLCFSASNAEACLWLPRLSVVDGG